MPLDVSEEDICPSATLQPVNPAIRCFNPPAFLLSGYDSALLGAEATAHALWRLTEASCILLIFSWLEATQERTGRRVKAARSMGVHRSEAQSLLSLPALRTIVKQEWEITRSPRAADFSLCGFLLAALSRSGGVTFPSPLGATLRGL